MSYRLEKHRERLTMYNRNFPKDVNACKTPEEVRDLILKYIRLSCSASNDRVLFVSLSSETIKAECPQREKLLNKLQELLIQHAKLYGYDIESFSNENNSLALVLPEDLHPGRSLFGGLVGGGIESTMFFQKKIDSLKEAFVETTDIAFQAGLI